jgi:hypothetical protein
VAKASRRNRLDGVLEQFPILPHDIPQALKSFTLWAASKIFTAA